MTALRLALLALISFVAGSPLAAQPKDNFGDPLPERAKARVGTTRMHKPGGGAEWSGAALTPDGKFLLSPVPGGAIEKIDVTTGRPAGAIGEKVPARTGREYQFLSTDGSRGLSLSDTTATVWEAKTGRVLTSVTTRVDGSVPGALATAALSADGSTLAFGANERPEAGKKLTAIVWTVGEGKRRLDVEVEQDRYVCVALSPNGKILATWGETFGNVGDMLVPPATPVQFWDATNGKKLGSFTAKDGPLPALTFTPDGKSATFADAKGVVVVIDPTTGAETRRLSARAGPHSYIAFAPDGKTLALAYGHGVVTLWDFVGDKLISTTNCPVHVDGNGAHVAFTGDKQLVAWAIAGSKAVVWEVPAGKLLSPHGGHPWHVDSLAFTPDGKELLTRGTDWNLTRWDASTGKPLGTPPLEVPKNVNLPYFRSTRPLLGGTKIEAWAGDVRYVFDASTGKRLYDLGIAGNGNSPHLCANGELTLTPLGVDPGVLPPVGKPLKVAVKELATGKALCEIELASREFYTATRTADKKCLLTQVHLPTPGESRRDYILTLWDLATGKNLGETKVPGDPPWFAPTPAPDNKTVLTSTAPGALRVIDLTTGKARQIETNGLTVCAGPVLSPNGKLFAVGLCDYADLTTNTVFDVRLYDTETGKPLKTFRGHIGLVSALAFAPDGKTLASGSFDTTILLWDLSTLPAPK